MLVDTLVALESIKHQAEEHGVARCEVELIGTGYDPARSQHWAWTVCQRGGAQCHDIALLHDDGGYEHLHSVIR